MVFALQVFYALTKFGGESLLGPTVALSLIRELGPVVSALMVTGRAGSALASEIGIMRITEQIDALECMATLLDQERPRIAAANTRDLQAAADKGLSGAKLDRLRLSDKVLGEMAMPLPPAGADVAVFEARTAPVWSPGVAFSGTVIVIGIVTWVPAGTGTCTAQATGSRRTAAPPATPPRPGAAG